MYNPEVNTYMVQVPEALQFFASLAQELPLIFVCKNDGFVAYLQARTYASERHQALEDQKVDVRLLESVRGQWIKPVSNIREVSGDSLVVDMSLPVDARTKSHAQYLHEQGAE